MYIYAVNPRKLRMVGNIQYISLYIYIPMCFQAAVGNTICVIVGVPSHSSCILKLPINAYNTVNIFLSNKDIHTLIITHMHMYKYIYTYTYTHEMNWGLR